MQNAVCGKLYNSKNECIFDGDWIPYRLPPFSLYHGNGVLYSKGEMVYSGGWFKGLRHGFGHQVYANGAEYIGEWHYGVRTGEGKYIVNDVMMFTGEFELKPIKGKLFANASRTAGDVRYGGEVTTEVGDDGHMVILEHGRGIEFRDDGSIAYDGEFTFGKRCGVGREFDVRGRLSFKGEFNNGVRHGRGKTCYEGTQALMCDGEWRDGTLHGEVTEYFKNGRVWFKGRYENGVRQGHGVLYDYTGVVHEGLFRDGAPDRRATKRMLREETERKKARQRVISLCEKSKHLVDLPRCAVCITEMMEGDEVYVYTTCGHRVCACVKKQTVDQKWVTCCPTCRADDQSMVRVW